MILDYNASTRSSTSSNIAIILMIIVIISIIIIAIWYHKKLSPWTSRRIFGADFFFNRMDFRVMLTFDNESGFSFPTQQENKHFETLPTALSPVTFSVWDTSLSGLKLARVLYFLAGQSINSDSTWWAPGPTEAKGSRRAHDTKCQVAARAA